MAIRLNKEAESILKKFHDRSIVTRDQRQKYRDLALAYDRFARIFLLSIQDALPYLCQENVDDIDLVLSYVCDSMHWARRSLVSTDSTDYKTVNYTLDRTEKTELRESHDLIFHRLTAYCPHGKLLENSLIRLTWAYNLANSLLKVGEAIAFTRTRRDGSQRKLNQLGLN